MKKMIYLLLVLVMLLVATGCGEETPEMILEDRSESKTWESMPTFTYGQLETEQLTVVPWYDGRMESVSGNTWLETKDGYYEVSGSWLYYADKENLDLWVPVCNKPNCNHTPSSWSYDQVRCNAWVGGNSVWIREGRIWFEAGMDYYSELNPDPENIRGNAIYSKALDGTDTRMEFRHDAMELSTMGGGSSGYEQGSRYSIVILNTIGADGLENLSVLLMTAQGAKIVHEQKGENLSVGHGWSPFYGDDAFYIYAIGQDLLRLEGEELIPMDVSAYEANGGYLSGNFLRQFRPGDGYYDVNLETGEEVKLCDPQLESSTADIVLPNCIIEHNINAKDLDVNAPREMRIFDGTQWRTVQLPEELQYQQIPGAFIFSRFGSDRIVFVAAGIGSYQIMLDRDELTMELQGSVSDS